MNFFSHMEDITYHNHYYSQFIEKIDMCRNDMLAADDGLLCDKGRYVNIDEAFELTDGRMTVEYKKILFECFYHYKPIDKLYVFLNGALTKTRPQFSRWSYYKFLDGCMLNIADPMYRIYDELILGWYYGNQEFNLRVYIAEIAKKIAGKIGVANHNIIFYGSSGGGAAVIECASHIEGSKAVSINPQVVLAEYFYADIFERITHNDLSRDEKWHRNNSIYYLQHNCGSKHLIFVNVRCESDMQQVGNICNAMGIEVKYGLNIFGGLIIWLYDCWCEPYINAHDIQDSFCMFVAITKVLEVIYNCKSMERLNSFCSYINEWWSSWWKMELYWRGKQPDLHYLIECAKTSKRVALFGTGVDAKRICGELLDIPGENFYGVSIVLDNNECKAGDTFNGIAVVSPKDINKWSDYFIIIATSNYELEIRRQLECYGLIHKKDFITLKDLYK